MTAIAPRTTLIDLQYLGEPGHIATAVLETDEGLALVDPGPATTLDRLREALAQAGASIEDVRFALVTHIHLDHSGGAGLLARLAPRLRVVVHERGAPHLAEPARLLASATRIYGDRMAELWGEVAPVPADRLQPVAGGETLRLGRRAVRVAYTPGHAWHHVCYLDEESGLAFTGDVVGEQPPGSRTPIPVTPPPDIEVEEMLASGRRILEWRPERLFVTHFGPVEAPAEFVREHAERLDDWAGRVRDSLQEPGSDEARAERFADAAWPELLALLPEPARPYLRREVLAGNWVGLARYWRTRGRDDGAG